MCIYPLQRSSGLGTSTYHLQRALPGGIVLMELAFQVIQGEYSHIIGLLCSY